MDSITQEMDEVQRAEERATYRWEQARQAVRRAFREGRLDDEWATWLEGTNLDDAAKVIRLCVNAATYKDIAEALRTEAACALSDLQSCVTAFIDDETERRLGL